MLTCPCPLPDVPDGVIFANRDPQLIGIRAGPWGFAAPCHIDVCSTAWSWIHQVCQRSLNLISDTQKVTGMKLFVVFKPNSPDDKKDLESFVRRVNQAVGHNKGRIIFASSNFFQGILKALEGTEPNLLKGAVCGLLGSLKSKLNFTFVWRTLNAGDTVFFKEKNPHMAFNIAPWTISLLGMILILSPLTYLGYACAEKMYKPFLEEMFLLPPSELKSNLDYMRPILDKLPPEDDALQELKKSILFKVSRL